MGNPHRGEVALHVGARKYVLRFTIGSLCQLETSLNKVLPTILSDVSNDSTFTVSAVRALLHSSLLHDQNLDLISAGHLIDAVGLMATMTKLSDCIACSFPKHERASSSGDGPHTTSSSGWDWPRLHAQWLALDLDESAFWQTTPAQMTAIFKGKQATFARQHNERAWLAWHIAALTRAKKIPDLKKLMVKETDGPRRYQTAEEQFAIFQAMAKRQSGIRRQN